MIVLGFLGLVEAQFRLGMSTAVEQLLAGHRQLCKFDIRLQVEQSDLQQLVRLLSGKHVAITARPIQ